MVPGGRAVPVGQRQAHPGLRGPFARPNDGKPLVGAVFMGREDHAPWRASSPNTTPFHNGHLLHLTETRRKTGCDYLVVAMAGCFTQRGEPALQDKWARARAALMGGADLVLELPAPIRGAAPPQWFAGAGWSCWGRWDWWTIYPLAAKPGICINWPLWPPCCGRSPPPFGAAAPGTSGGDEPSQGQGIGGGAAIGTARTGCGRAPIRCWPWNTYRPTWR